MTIYRYTTDSLIDEVRVVTNVAGGARAYLHAREGTDPKLLLPLHEKFAELNWKGVPHTDEKPVLELRGFKHAEELCKTLADHGWIKGQPTIIHTGEDRANPNDKLRNLTLKATGIMYNVGDAAYLTYATKGLLQKRAIKGNTSAEWLNLGAGIGYAIGGTALSIFGSKDQSEREIKGATEKLHHFLQKEQVKIRDDSSTHEILKDEHRPFLDRATRFMRHYPSEILNTVYTGVGILLAVSAAKLAFAPRALGKSGELLEKLKESRTTLKHVNGSAESLGKIEHAIDEVEQKMKAMEEKLKAAEGRYAVDPKSKTARRELEKTEHRFAIENGETPDQETTRKSSERKDIGLGVVTMSSAMLGLFVKEKKPIEGQPKRRGLGGVIDWIQEKPLRATGIGFGISTLFHAASSVQKYREGDRQVKGTVAFRIVFVLANIAAELMLFLSSKGHGQGVKTDNSIPHSVIASAAESISQQPVADQQRLVDSVSGFLSSADVLGGKADEIAKLMRAHLEGNKNNPWSRHVQQAPGPLPAQPTLQVTDATLETPAKEAANWQARTEQQKTEMNEHANALA